MTSAAAVFAAHTLDQSWRIGWLFTPSLIIAGGSS